MANMNTILGDDIDIESMTKEEIIHRLMDIGHDIEHSGYVDSEPLDELAPSIASEKTFFFGNFDRAVYCFVRNVWIRLVQTGEGSGNLFLTFHQDCNSRKGDRVSGSDWTFRTDWWDRHGALIRTIQAGYWTHRCGLHLVELRTPFTWIPGSLNPVDHAVRGRLTWTRKTEVSSC